MLAQNHVSHVQTHGAPLPAANADVHGEALGFQSPATTAAGGAAAVRDPGGVVIDWARIYTDALNTDREEKKAGAESAHLDLDEARVITVRVVLFSV